MRESRIVAILTVLATVTVSVTPARALSASRFGGHLSLGYSHLFVTDSPGGSLSVAAGVDYPLEPALRLGADVAFSLLGSRVLEQDGQIANLDYSLFEALLMLHWTPTGLGPLGRVSFGPSLVSAKAELATSGGGIEFTPFAIGEIAPGFALDATLIQSSSRSPVRAGVEFGVHAAFLADETWTVASARLAIHY